MDIKPYIRKVQYYETDKMGIVHHSNYIRWFEEARIDFMENIGYTYADMEKKGVMIPVLGVSANYKSGVGYGDSVVITTTLTNITAVKLSFSYEIRDKKSGELKMSGASDHCFVDSNFKPCSIKKKMPEFYEQMVKLGK